jgi:hypothetical protein
LTRFNHVTFSNFRHYDCSELPEIHVSPAIEFSNRTVPHKSLLQLEQRCLVFPRRHHQPRQEFDSLSAILSYCLSCLLLSPTMQSNVMYKQTCTSRKSPISFSSLVGWLVGWLVSWLPHIRADLVASYLSGQTKTACRLLNRKSGFSIRKGVLLYKQLIRPANDYAWPIWRSAAHTHIGKIQVFQSKRFRIATNTFRYNGDRHIHEKLRVLSLADKIKTLIESFDSKLIGGRSPFFSETWQMR